MTPATDTSRLDALALERMRTLPAQHFTSGAPAAPAPAPAVAASAGDQPRLAGTSATDRLRRGQLADAPRFRIESLLGMGATGQVYSVHDRNLDRLVAVKVLNDAGRADDEQLQSFLREARIAASLAHPNVLPVYELDLDAGGRPWFSMGRIGGRTLGAAILESSRDARHAAIGSWNRVVSTTIDLCQAAAYAHHRGIVHQDIKPDNVLIGDFGEVLLLDWGSAGHIDASGRIASGIYGTPLYMSPEQARREGADARSDVYCIGATLFHALALRPPTWSDDDQEFWRMKRAGELQPPDAGEREGVPPELFGIALKAMEADPARRYPTAEAMRADLEAYQGGLAVSVHRYSLWRRLRGWYRRHAAMLWVCVVAGLLVAAAVGAVVNERLKEAGAWIEVAHEDFSSPQGLLPGRWLARYRLGWSQPWHDASLPDEHARLENGRLVMDPGDGLMNVTWDSAVAGDFAAEWTYTPLGLAHNLNCYVGGVDRESGFTFHVGGFGPADQCTLTYGKETGWLCSEPLPTTLVVGRAYRFRVERAARRVRLEIDGMRVIDWPDAQDIGGGLGQRFGFDTIRYQRLAVDDVRVYRRAVAERVSPIEIGDKLYQLGHWRDAAAQYREVRDTHPGTDLATRAEFRLALSARAQDDVAEAMRLFARFAADHPGHELAVVALRGAADLARAHADRDALAAARSGMLAHRGHPLLIGEGRQAVDEVYAVLKQLLILEAGLEQVREAVLAALRTRTDTERELGIDLKGYRLKDIGSSALQRLPAAEVLALGIDDPTTRAAALRKLGRMDEALLAATGMPEAVMTTLMVMGRLREAAAVEGGPLDLRMLVLLRLGAIDEMRRIAPHHSLVEEWDVHAGGIDAYLARYHDSDPLGMEFGTTTRVIILTELGRAEQILREYRHTSSRAHGLLLQKRYPEILRSVAGDWQLIGRTAVVMAIDGDLPGAIAVLEPLAVGGAPSHSMVFDAGFVAGAVIRVHGGDRDGARALMAKAATPAWRDTLAQTAWHTAAYATGTIDDAGFLAQPERLMVDARLVLAQALKLELDGRTGEAAERWQALLALPFWRRDMTETIFELARWRVRAAGLEVPAGVLPTGGLYFR